MNVICSRDHNIYTETISKVALSCEATKDLFRKMEFTLSLMDISNFHSETYSGLADKSF